MTKKTIFTPLVLRNKGYLLDSRLSWKSKGVLTYILAFQGIEEIDLNPIIKNHRERFSVLGLAIDELLQVGYLQHICERNKEGDLLDYYYAFVVASSAREDIETKLRIYKELGLR